MSGNLIVNYGPAVLVGCAALLSAGTAAATLVHSGDSTIQGGLCVGFDCSSNEPMGFVTIKIEENNLRIGAADSSTVSGFPTTDWQIEFNSSASGGGSYFMIRDCGSGGVAGSVSSTCGGTPMLTIEGGADNESIHVDSAGNQGGNVGFGTATPVVDLHTLSGNTPTLRLDQDNSSGFTPQSWDLAGNESNFFIRDVTNGSALPFRIEPGTASNTLYLDNQERIGIGTTAPDGPLHIRFNSVYVTLEDSGDNDKWFITHQATNDGDLEFTSQLDGGPGATLAFVIEPNGDATLAGTLTENSDMRNKMAIEPVDSDAVLAKVAALPLATWTYKHDADRGVRHMGPMAQDFHTAFGLGATATGISTLDTSGVALAAIQALEAANRKLRAEMAVLRADLDRLTAR